jgi:hypothetical protein
MKVQWLFDAYGEVAGVVAAEVVLISFFAFCFSFNWFLIIFLANLGLFLSNQLPNVFSSFKFSCRILTAFLSAFNNSSA